MTPLKFIASCRLPTEYGIFTMHGFEEPSGQEHIALSMGNIANGEPVLSRIQQSRWVAAGAPELAGTELAVAAGARVSSGGGCRTHGEDLVVATGSWRGEQNDDACGSGWFGPWPRRRHGRRHGALGSGG